MRPVQFWWCKDKIFLMKTKFWSSHYQICTSAIGMGWVSNELYS